jgi:hypothetical protein
VDGVERRLRRGGRRLTAVISRTGACAALVVAVLSTIGACREKPTAGEKCTLPDQLLCGGSDRALLCEPAPSGGATAWADIPCKGARGCLRKSDADECDDTIAGEGDPCPRGAPLDYACTPDRTRALLCKDGRYALWRACRGPDACQVESGRNIRCDTTLGEPGDPCAQQGTYACSSDSRAMLLCDGSSLATASSCAGPAGCHIRRDTRKVECDDSLAREGDTCDQPRRIACAVDRKAELVCLGSRYAKKRDCRRADCRLEGSELFCD